MWVSKTKHNHDGSTQYEARLVIKRYKQTYFGETYAPFGKLTTLRDLIPIIGQNRTGSNMDLLDVVIVFLNPEIDYDDIFMTVPEGWPDHSNAQTIIVRLRKALYGQNQALRLGHNHINASLLSRQFTQSSADPNLDLTSDSILIFLYVDDISMSYLEAATKALIEVNVKLSEMYNITNLGPVCQFVGIEISRDDNGISIDQKAYIATILRLFGMEHTHVASTPMDPNVKLDLAEDWGE